MSLFTIVLPSNYANILQLSLTTILFFVFLHLFLKITFTMEDFPKLFGLMNSWFNKELCTFVLIVLLSVLFTNFVLTSVISIESNPKY
jgi:hypothetical protein